jgi:hypothetical protein
MEVARGAIRQRRYWEEEGVGREYPPRDGGGSRVGEPGVSTAGRVIRGWTPAASRRMRWTMAALRWEELGSRPAMITLTYPKDWRAVVPNRDVLKRHMDAFYQRWARRSGTPRGVWVLEFQPRLRQLEQFRDAPHLHLYLGLPEWVTEEDFSELVGRTIRRKMMERAMGSYLARRKLGPVRGQFAEWLLRSWSEIVGTTGTEHARHGADVAPMFWTEEVQASPDWTGIAHYLWSESGKVGQKEAPADFGTPGKQWGIWGGVPTVEGSREMSEAVAMQVRRVLFRLYENRIAAGRRKGGLPMRKVRRPKGRDGLTVFDLDGVGVGGRLLAWAEDLVEWRRAQADERSESAEILRRRSYKTSPGFKAWEREGPVRPSRPQTSVQ